MTHTPGPWTTDNVVVSAEDRAVAEVPWNVSDARLIAAAPELLEALIQVRDLLRPVPESERVDRLRYTIPITLDRLVPGIVDVLDAAIAKATGGAA